MKFPPDNPGGRVAGMKDSRGELFNKNYCYFYVPGEIFGEEGDGFVGRVFGTIPIKGFDYAPWA